MQLSTAGGLVIAPKSGVTVSPVLWTPWENPDSGERIWPMRQQDCTSEARSSFDMSSSQYARTAVDSSWTPDANTPGMSLAMIISMDQDGSSNWPFRNILFKDDPNDSRYRFAFYVYHTLGSYYMRVYTRDQYGSSNIQVSGLETSWAQTTTRLIVIIRIDYDENEVRLQVADAGSTSWDHDSGWTAQTYATRSYVANSNHQGQFGFSNDTVGKWNIEGIGFWHDVLTDSQVSSLLNGGSLFTGHDVAAMNPKAAWCLTEGSGSFNDLSGNDYDAIRYNAPVPVTGGIEQMVVDRSVCNRAEDVTSHGDHFAQSTFDSQPEWREAADPDGRKGLLFDGVDDYMLATLGSSVAQPHHVISQAEDPSTGLFLYDGSGASERLALSNVSGIRKIDGGASLSCGSVSAGDPAVLTALYNGASSYLRRNGSSVGSGNAGSNPVSSMKIGSSHWPSNYADTSLTYISLNYGSAYSDARRDQIEAWLAV